MLLLLLLLSVLGLVPATLAASSDTSLAFPRPAITFFWTSANDSTRLIKQCESFEILTLVNPSATSKPVPPFFLLVAPEGMEPEIHPGGNNYSWFTWDAGLPVGSNATFAMIDSQGSSGGAVDGYTIVDGYQNCTISEKAAKPAMTVDFESMQPCDQIELDIHGGHGPWTVSVTQGLTGLFSNVTSEASSVRINNTFTAGQVFNIFVTDSRGDTSPVSSDLTSFWRDASCASRPARKTGSSFPIYTVITVVLGVTLLLVIIGFFVRRYLQHQRYEDAAALRAVRNSRSQSPSSPGVDSGSYRLSNGAEPLVTPFIIPSLPRPPSSISLASMPGSNAAMQGSAYSSSAYGETEYGDPFGDDRRDSTFSHQPSGHPGAGGAATYWDDDATVWGTGTYGTGRSGTETLGTGTWHTGRSDPRDFM